MMQQKKRDGRRRKGDTVVFMLSALLVVSVGMSVYLWPRSSTNVASASLTSLSAADFSCSVDLITDGDTLRCADGRRVRLHAVAAREKDESCSPGHPCPSASGAAATAKLRDLALGQALQCVQTGTSYNRVTAICRNEAGIEINCAMVQSGTTLIWPRFNAERAICN